MIRALQPGEPITAAWIAQLVGAVNRLGDYTGEGAGARAAARTADAAVLAAVAGTPEHFVLCRVVDVRLAAGAGPGPAYLPDDVTYHVRGVRRPGIDLDHATPVYGRPVRLNEARVYPAGVGDVCFVVRSPAADGSGAIDAQLMLLPGSEVVARRRCDQQSPALAPEVLERERRRIGLPKIEVGLGDASVVGRVSDAGEGVAV